MSHFPHLLHSFLLLLAVPLSAYYPVAALLASHVAASMASPVYINQPIKTRYRIIMLYYHMPIMLKCVFYACSMFLEMHVLETKTKSYYHWRVYVSET